MKQLLIRLCVVAAVIASASSAMANTPANTNPLNVKRCDLETRGGRAGGYSSSTGFTGYVSGYTPGAPYYFNDPLGTSYYQPPTSSSSQLYIDFVNVTSKEMKVIEFGAEVRGVLVAEARDQGRFSPNADIKRKYGVNPNIVPRQGVSLSCVPLKIEFADGTTWTRPSMPPPSSTLYQGHP
ncbi:MAG: hypothetical protein JO219_10690 [Candidatus Eremiobacteraeota bacterium]|nr:hypothetical protein [Candidatus Eremiobacteraeota bacterium]MBV8365549.1 hypothetical protein [Candidatus Eremiobacteraeota bacterium]